MKRIILLLSLFPCLLTAQTVTTVATNSGVTDDLIFGQNGHLLGADYIGSAVFEINLADGSSDIYSDGYNTPNGLALHPDGTLYMADNQGNKIFKIFPDGTSELFVEMNNPSGLIFELDSDTLIATSYYGDALVKIAPDSTIVPWTSGGNLSGGPVGLCFDESGDLYVGNFDDRKITQVLEDGTQVPITQGPTSGYLGFIEYTGGYIYGTLYSTNKIFRYKLGGSEEPEVFLGSTLGNTDGGSGEARFNKPNGILASPHGDTLYVSDYGTSNIRMITNLEGNPSSGHEKINTQEIEVSPNPFSDFTNIYFELKEASVISIYLMDMDGKTNRVILENIQFETGNHQVKIDAFHFPAGINHIVIKEGENNILTKKVIRSN